MKVQAEKFAATLRTIGAVAAEPAIAASQFVRLIAKGDSIRLTLAGIMFGDGSVKADLPSKEEWTFYADRKVLMAFVSSASGTIELTLKDSTMVVVGSSQTMKLSAPTEAISGYGLWPTTEKIALPINGEDLAMLNQYCSTGAGGEQFSAVQFIKGFGALASDSVVLSLVKNAVCPKLVLPSNLASEAAKSKADSILMGKNGVGVVLEAGRLYQTLHTSLKSCPVDKLTEVAKTGLSKPVVFSCPASDLESAVGDLNKYPYTGASLIGEVVLQDKQLKIQVTFPSGTAKRSLDVKPTPKTDLTTQWALNRIYPWIRYISGKDSTASITCRRMDAATVFDCTLDKNQYVLVFSDL